MQVYRYNRKNVKIIQTTIDLLYREKTNQKSCTSLLSSLSFFCLHRWKEILGNFEKAVRVLVICTVSMLEIHIFLTSFHKGSVFRFLITQPSVYRGKKKKILLILIF